MQTKILTVLEEMRRGTCRRPNSPLHQQLRRAPERRYLQGNGHIVIVGRCQADDRQADKRSSMKACGAVQGRGKAAAAAASDDAGFPEVGQSEQDL